ncbi:MAG: SRPBCC domain-containing protein [Phycisphaerales bacterium]
MMKSLLMELVLLVAFASSIRAFGSDAYFAPAGDRLVRAEAYVDAPIDTVWETLSTSAGWTAFLGAATTIELRPGGKMEVLFVPDAPEGQRGSEGCTVLSYLPKRMLSFSWNAPPSFPEVRNGEHKTIVVIELFPAGAKRTLVRLKHHGWPGTAETTEQWDGVFAYFEKAWPGVLDALKEHFAPKAPSDVRADAAGPKPNPKAGWLYTFVGLKRADLIETATDEEKKQFGAHAAYVRDLALAGTVVFAGPSTDMKGPAVIVMDVRTEAEARELMENDPAVKNGLMKAKLHPVALSFVRWRDEAPSLAAKPKP